MPLEHEEEFQTEVYRTCSVSVQCVRVKEEPEVEHEYDWCVANAGVKTVKDEPSEQAEYSETTIDWSLYAEHDIKDELVIGPEQLQLQDEAVLKRISPENEEIISERKSKNTESWSQFKNCHPGSGLKASFVRLERLPVDKYKQSNSIFSDNVTSQDKNDIKTKPEIHTEMQEQFLQKSNLNPSIPHSAKKNKKKGIECEICSRNFRNFKYLVRHLKIHIRMNIHKCTICKKKFSHKLNWVRHMKKHKSKRIYKQVSQNKYKCEICLKTFKCRYFLNKHTGRHERQAQLKCKYCNKQISKLSRLIEHERIHTGEKPYKCDKCLKGFARKRYAATHMKMCKDKKPRHTNKKHIYLYECDVCMQLLASNFSLTNHKRIHTGERPFQCLICMQRFQTQSAVYLHKRRKHALYTCEACREQFGDKRHLLVHIHCLCEALSCPVCELRFEGRAPLLRHARTHIWTELDGA